MPRYKLTIEYDGTPYSGWQKQETAPSVQAALEEAFAKFMAAPVELSVAGRTDSGVHAKGQVAHVDLASERKPFNICEGVNRLLLPHRIAILEAEEVHPEWHARFDAKARHYLYRIINRSSRLTMDADRAWHLHNALDLDVMQQAANMLIGNHDFTSFRSVQCQSKSPVKTLDTFEIKRRKDKPEQIMIKTSAKSFLHNQVRIMVGTIAMVGMGKWTLDKFKAALEAKDRQAGGLTAPAHGLYLMKVDY